VKESAYFGGIFFDVPLEDRKGDGRIKLRWVLGIEDRRRLERSRHRFRFEVWSKQCRTFGFRCS
jgi:hypothetical protein